MPLSHCRWMRITGRQAFLRLCFYSCALLGAAAARAQTQAPAASSVLAGHVTNARTGAPMARVLVQANGRAVFTNAEGRFQLSDAAGTIASVQFTKPGFALSPEQRDSNSIPVASSSGTVTLEVALWPEAILAGTVSSSEGDPLPHLAVTAQRYVMQNGMRQIQQAGFTFTGPHGNFRLPVPAGDYIVQTRYAPPDFTRSLAVLPAQSPTHSANDGTGTIHIASGQELHVDLHPQLAAAVHILLPIEGNEAQRSLAITATTAEGAAYQPPRRVTQDGLSVDLPSGTYQLSARLAAPDGERIGQITLAVPDHDATAPPLHLDLLPSVPVVVTLDPASAANATASFSVPPSAAALNLQLEPSDLTSSLGDQPLRITGRGSGGTVFSAAPGSYRLAGGDGSAWALLSATFGGVDLLRDPLVVGANSTAEPIRIVVSRPNGAISGVTRVGGVPAACWIVLVSEAGTLPRFFVRRSGADGQFTIGGLPLRSYSLLATTLLSSADFGQPAILDQFHTYVQRVSVTSSSAAALDLTAVPVRELYP